MACFLYMKRIIIFSTAYLPFIGGAELAIKEITDRLGDFEFDLITARMDSKLPKVEKVGNVNVYRVGFGSKFDKFLLPILGKKLALNMHRKEGYDLIWSMMASQASVAASLMRRELEGVKLVLTLQEGDNEAHLKRYVFGNDWLYGLLIKPWHDMVFKCADIVQVISNYLGNRALEKGVKKEIIVIPNGVDLLKFKFRGKKSGVSKLKMELGFNELDVLLVTVSRLVKKNAVGDIVRSLVYLPENVKLLVVGEGEDRQRIEEIVRNNELGKRVKMVGRIEYDEVPEYLWVSDIFVRPSLSEGMGNSFIEAMVARLPVIATPVGGIVDFLVDRKTGLFCRVSDPKSIAEQVEVFMGDEKLREDVVDEACRVVKRGYDWNVVARRMKKDVFERRF